MKHNLFISMSVIPLNVPLTHSSFLSFAVKLHDLVIPFLSYGIMHRLFCGTRHARIGGGGGGPGVRTPPPPPSLELWQKCGYRVRE